MIIKQIRRGGRSLAYLLRTFSSNQAEERDADLKEECGKKSHKKQRQGANNLRSHLPWRWGEQTHGKNAPQSRQSKRAEQPAIIPAPTIVDDIGGQDAYPRCDCAHQQGLQGMHP